MYTSFFGLEENPFKLIPDPKYLFLSKQHRDTLNYLIYGITEKKGFIIVTGGIGTGKTTICRSLLSALDGCVDSALIFNSFVSDIELLAAINEEFGIKTPAERQTRKGYIDDLNEFLLANFSSGRNAVLLIDEAQNLFPSVLEQIRMLSNLETESEKLIQIVLLGQPELKKVLNSPSLKQLNERIAVRYDLTPLSQKQVQDYIKHRLAVAGGIDGSIKILENAHKKIYNYSQGIPRRINAICDRALLIAYTRNTISIDKRIIKDAVNDIGGEFLTNKNGFEKIKRGGLLFCFIIVVFSFLIWMSMVSENNIFTLIPNLDIFK